MSLADLEKKADELLAKGHRVLGDAERQANENKYLREYIKGLELLLTSMKLGRNPPPKAMELMDQAKRKLVSIKSSL